MVGILLMSHGEMAEGMKNSAELFFGKEIEKLKALCLTETESLEEFDLKIKQSVEELSNEDGLIVLCDLFGGTPCNRMTKLLDEKVKVISGMNFTMLLELLGKRLCVNSIDEIDVNELIEIGKSGIIYLNEFADNSIDDEEGL